MIKFKQIVYSAGIDPVNQANWIGGDIETNQFGTQEPAYISNIDYERVAYLLIETIKNTNEVNIMFKASLHLKIGSFGSSANYSYDSKFQSLFASNKVKVSVLGGQSNI